MNQKPTTCPICGAPWLACIGGVTRIHECLNCGARIAWVDGDKWYVTIKQEIDKLLGPVVLTRNAHMMPQEGYDRLMDDLGL